MLRRACRRMQAPDASHVRHRATQAVVSWSSWNLGLGCWLAGERCRPKSNWYWCRHIDSRGAVFEADEEQARFRETEDARGGVLMREDQRDAGADEIGEAEGRRHIVVAAQ